MRAPILPSADFFNRYNEADFNLGLKKLEDQLSGPKYGGQNIVLSLPLNEVVITG